MPQILALAAGAVLVLYALRWVRREYGRVETALLKMDLRVRRTSPSGSGGASLVFDAAEGVYRPVE